MAKPKMVSVPRAELAKLLKITEDSARAQLSQYNRKTKTYLWNDDVWKAGYAYEFAVVRKLRFAMIENLVRKSGSATE